MKNRVWPFPKSFREWFVKKFTFSTNFGLTQFEYNLDLSHLSTFHGTISEMFVTEIGLNWRRYLHWLRSLERPPRIKGCVNPFQLIPQRTTSSDNSILLSIPFHWNMCRYRRSVDFHYDLLVLFWSFFSLIECVISTFNATIQSNWQVHCFIRWTKKWLMASFQPDEIVRNKNCLNAINHLNGVFFGQIPCPNPYCKFSPQHPLNCAACPQTCIQ